MASASRLQVSSAGLTRANRGANSQLFPKKCSQNRSVKRVAHAARTAKLRGKTVKPARAPQSTDYMSAENTPVIPLIVTFTCVLGYALKVLVDGLPAK